MAACCLAMMTISFCSAGSAVLARAIQNDFKLDDRQLGVFLGAAFWGLVASILLAGPLADRFGSRVIFAASAALQAAGLFGLSTANSYFGLVAWAVVAGLGQGVVDALTTPIVCAVFPDRRVGMSNALHAFYGLGVIFTTGVVVLLRSLDWPWWAVMRTLGVLAIPYGLLVLITPMPQQSHEGAIRQPTRTLLLRPSFIVFLLAIGLATMAEVGASNWLPTYLGGQSAPDGREWIGALGLAVFGVMMAASRLSTSAFVNRLGVRRLFLCGGALCAISLAMASLPVGSWFSAAWLAVVGFAVAAFWPTIVGTAGNRFPQAGATMYSSLAAAGNLGAALGPIFVGAIADWQNRPTAMRLLAIAPVVMVALLLPVLGNRKK